ncbi:hypothetical protein ACPCHT_35560 [Nucisporomicrobium flavum]|uniref:hypothetical protein n=1 Tax=Nucisporomicrobium flavum TaxID=2785915 RepID=UPI003C30A433
MTGAEFSGVDLDLLADYVGGALDGTPDEAVVAALVADDPAWRSAYDQLAGGTAAVTAVLRTWGTEPEPMPADVLSRLESAFGSPSAPTSASSSSASDSGSSSADGFADDDGAGGVDAGLATSGAGVGGVTGRRGRMEPGSDGAAPVRHLVAVPDDGERPATARKRTRRLKWAAPIGIAAGVLAFLGFGIQQWDAADSSDATSAAGSAAEQDAPGRTLALPAGPAEAVSSGVDYTERTLTQVATRAAAASDAGKRVPQTADAGEAQGKGSAPGAGVMADRADPLVRLRAQESLLACLDAISRQNGAGPVTAQAVDYARFEGAPALVVQFAADNGTWVWATGADCGRGGSGADRLAAVKVG